MRDTVKTSALFAAVALIGINGSAQAAPSTGTATATIFAPITVTKTTDLAFGTIVAGAAAANVTITSAGVRTCDAGLTCSGTISAVSFNIAGSTGEIVTVSSDAVVTLASGANTMTATLSPNATTLMLAGGVASFKVGGTLSVGANQATGTYTGTFNVTVDYN